MPAVRGMPSCVARTGVLSVALTRCVKMSQITMSRQNGSMREHEEEWLICFVYCGGVLYTKKRRTPLGRRRWGPPLGDLKASAKDVPRNNENRLIFCRATNKNITVLLEKNSWGALCPDPFKNQNNPADSSSSPLEYLTQDAEEDKSRQEC